MGRLFCILSLAAGLVASGVGRPAAAQSPCVGDCRNERSVTVDSLLILVNIVLGTSEAAECSSGLPSGEASVDVSTIVRAVHNALNGCPPLPTASPEPSSSPTAPPTETPEPTSTVTPTGTATVVPVHFCDLPGSVRTTAEGITVVPGGVSSEIDPRFLQLPDGFCAHPFARVPNVREMRFAPGGELFVASPSMFSTGGGQGGRNAILVLSDDDRDGNAEPAVSFLGGISATHGMLFADSWFYYQNGSAILRLPYHKGDRVPAGESEKLIDITFYKSLVHWPKPIDQADDGTIYIGNGGDQGDPCDAASPFHGGVLALDPAFPQGRQVSRGFRNPMSLRCARGYNRCYAVELSRDYTSAVGGREKVVPIRDGDDLGFPCCATRDLAYPDSPAGTDCSSVIEETGSFIVGDTPFDLAFETGLWPAPWSYRAYIPLHGVYGTWDGARLVALEMDPATGELRMGSDLSGQSSGAMMDFATGWDDRTRRWGRPAAVEFAEDGRLFIGNDANGDIVWVAPLDLKM